MQLSDKSGIHCDICSAEYKNDFVYYSYDFREVSVVNNLRPPINNILTGSVCASIDACALCAFEWFEQIKSNYKPLDKAIACDLCGKILAGNFKYYYCVVSKVDVNRTTSNVSVEDRLVDVIICTDNYASIVNRAAEVKKNTDWSSSSEVKNG